MILVVKTFHLCAFDLAPGFGGVVTRSVHVHGQKSHLERGAWVHVVKCGLIDPARKVRAAVLHKVRVRAVTAFEGFSRRFVFDRAG